MRIYGVDFTSRPRPRKPIACAVCTLERAALYLEGFVDLSTFEMFENFLASAPPWVGAFDFPFGQPRTLVEALGWPGEWAACVEAVARLTLPEFAQLIEAYRASRPAGQKHLLRATDRWAHARSPMMLHRVPVGRMFFHGAPRLLHAEVSVQPCRPRGRDRIVLEGYPALVARSLGVRTSYKSDTRAGQSGAQREARRELVAGLRSPALRERYGLEVHVPHALLATLVEQPMADQLDALFCAVQAAWAYRKPEPAYGIPTDVDSLEGWIADPGGAGKLR